MENKNFLLAILLSVAFLFCWSLFVVPRFASKPTTPPVSVPAPATTSPAEPGAASLAPAHPTSAASLTDLTLRDTQNEVVFAPLGGAIRHWRLVSKGHEVDLVNAPDAKPLPLETFPDTVFSLHEKGNQAIAQAVLPNRVKVTKTLTLNRESHLHDLTFRFDNPTGQPIEMKEWQWGWGPGLGTAEAEKKENAGLTRALSMGKLKIHVLKPGVYDELGQWAGVDNRYFLVAFLPVSKETATLNVVGSKEHAELKVRQTLSVPAQGSALIHYQMYAGPKGYTQLGHYKKNLEEAVDFGFFGPVGKLILKVIYWLQGVTGNYGWAIILLTLMLQILMTPLTIKSFKATMAMKHLQPQIAALQKAYKSDPKRLNIEMMNLYKKSGTNPFGGCLPMLMQLPIFWALFTTLRNAYELRGAPFMLWIQDLSAPEALRVFGLPLHILPLMMGGAMFVQQRMSGAPADPTQRQMMYMMPVMFAVMFYNFPAGLVLYWFVNNVVTMAIQWCLLQMNKKPLTLEVVR